MESQELDALRSIEDLSAYQAEVKARLTALNSEFAGMPMPDEARGEFATLKAQNDQIDKRVRELEARNRVIAELGSRDGNVERVDESLFDDRPANRGSLKERNIYDLSTIRADMSQPEVAKQQLRDRAMRAVELSVFPQVRDQAGAREQVERLLEGDNEAGDTGPGEIARRILTTGSPAYKRGFLKYLAGRERTNEERAAMALGAGSTGGYAVVYQLDPSFIMTSNLAVNPFRSIARQVTIAGTNEWRGITTAGVTAAYGAEGAAQTDNSPTLAQPAAIVQRASAFVQASIESLQDITGLQAELAIAFQDAKDTLEATQFTTGVGTTVFPQGIMVGATAQTTTATTNVFVVGDVYKLSNALPARWQANASFVANRATFNLIRQFDTTGGSNMWSGYPNPLQGGLANGGVTQGGSVSGQQWLRLLGYPTYEDTAVATAITTTTLIAVLGDFSRGFIIVDRIGMDVEVAPLMFDQASGLPNGNRGILAYWRNTSKVLAPTAFQVLKVL